LNIEYGQTTTDGQFTLLSNVCLGSCDKSPAMMIDGKHYHSLTSNSVVAILNGLSQNIGEGNE
jgi:NADH-quinone oxidoreductase subunit E